LAKEFKSTYGYHGYRGQAWKIHQEGYVNGSDTSPQATHAYWLRLHKNDTPPFWQSTYHLQRPISSAAAERIFSYLTQIKNKNKNNLPLATVLTILLYYRIDAESESLFSFLSEVINFPALAGTGPPGLSMRLYSSYIIIGQRISLTD